MEHAVLQEILTEIKGIKSDISELKSDVSELKSDVSELKSDVSGLKDDVKRLDAKIDGVESRLGRRITDAKHDMKKLLISHGKHILEDVEIVNGKLDRVIEQNSLLYNR